MHAFALPAHGEISKQQGGLHTLTSEFDDRVLRSAVLGVRSCSCEEEEVAFARLDSSSVLQRGKIANSYLP